MGDVAEPPRPFHRWARNERLERVPPLPRDYCLACGVLRYPETAEAQARAAGPCPISPNQGEE